MTPYDPDKNKESLKPEAARNEALAEAIASYCARSGLTLTMFAKRINYSYSAFTNFMHGRYHQVAGSGANIRKAAEAFMQQNPLEAQTEISGELYETSNVQVIRETFEQLLPKPVAYVIYAPPGSQKTFALQNETARFNLQELPKNGHGRRAVYVYVRQNIRPRDMMKRIAIACGCAASSSIDSMIQNLRWQFRGRRALLILDESQHLSIECMETIRELLDQPPFFSLLFAGSHNLINTFDRFSAHLEQCNSRIIAKVRLPGLERAEAEGIIARELAEYVGKMTAGEARLLYTELIKQSTTRDAFEKGRTYINVRTLTNALDQVKLQAHKTAQPAAGARAGAR